MTDALALRGTVRLLLPVVVAATLALSGCASTGTASTAAAPGTTTGGRTVAGADGTSSAPRAEGAPEGQAAGADWVRRENARPGSRDWRIPPELTATDSQVAGYADRASAEPGTTVRLFLRSLSPTVQVRAYRVGDYGGAHARLVWTSEPVPTTRQPQPVTDRTTRMVSAPWRPTTSLSTAGWPEGLYLLKLTAVGGSAAGRQRYIPLVIRSASTAGRLVLVSASATYAAYNAWGGASLYGGEDGTAGSSGTRAQAASLDRPFDGNGIRKLGQYELGPIWLAESLGLDLAYLTSADLEQAGILSGARGVVSLGHDEYWTVGMRDAVTAARNAGTNLAFLGANAAYWRIRFEDSPLGPDRVVVGYKDASLDPLARSHPREATTTFRGSPGSEPENSLTGLLYECFPARGAYVIADPAFALFKGTGVHQGSRIPGLVGVEIDRAYPIAGTPDTLEVVAHSPVACGSRGTTYSDSGYFTSPSGAGTFSTGTMSWSLALRGPDSSLGIGPETVAFTRRVTANLLAAMAAGPMGRTIAARPNLASLHPDASTSTGTGGRVGG